MVTFNIKGFISIHLYQEPVSTMPTFQAFTITCKHLSTQEDPNNLQALHEYYPSILFNIQAQVNVVQSFLISF
jgi:hypothetical protein